MLNTRHALQAGWCLLVVFSISAGVLATEDAKTLSESSPKKREEKADTDSAKSIEGLTPLNKQGTVLLDTKGKRVLLKTKVVLREGLLEMFCCLTQTKEHESILSLDAKAYVVHTGLLALGATTGTPVEYRPEYKPPTGQQIDVFVQWKDKKGKLHRVPANTWVQHAVHRYYDAKFEKLPDDLTIPKEDEDLTLRYDNTYQELSWYGPMSARQRDKLLGLSTDAAYRKAVKSFFEQTRPREMTANWIFAGSGFAVNTQTGEKFYEAEGGELICVANFPTAMIDVSIASSPNQEEGILFEPYTERIPPVGTEVTVELIPVVKQKAPAKPSVK